MADPYQVLGVGRDASDEDIKKAYRKLSRRYHPDANINNPNKDQAEAMFKQVQEAYTLIMHERETGTPFGAGGYGGGYSGGYGTGGYGGPFQGYGGGYTGWGGYGYEGQGTGNAGQNSTYQDEDELKYRAAANYINSGSYEEALNVLRGIANRTARWYYLSAIVNARTGNTITAQEFAQKAAQMEPGNMQYRQLLSQLSMGGQWYQNTGRSYGMPDIDFNNICWSICMFNLAASLCCPGSYCCAGPML